MKEKTKQELNFWLRMHKASVQPGLMMLVAGFGASVCWAFGMLMWGSLTGMTQKQFSDEGWFAITLIGIPVIQPIPLVVFLVTMHTWEKKTHADGKSE